MNKNIVFIGIDIGTTNTKILAIDNNNNITYSNSYITPKYIKNNESYFQIHKLELIFENTFKIITKKYIIGGVSFASVGESVVPIKNGISICDPLVWNDRCNYNFSKNIWNNFIKEKNEFSNLNEFDYTFSIYKMLYVMDKYHIETPDYWLPLSSFFCFTYTKEAIIDYSQCSRTFLLNQNTKDWNKELILKFNLFNKPIKIEHMGYSYSNKGDYPFFLGGHDHMVAAKCIDILLNKKTYILDSVGTSESVLGITESNKPFLDLKQLSTGLSFSSNRPYCIQGIHNSGIYIENLSKDLGFKNVNECINSLNPKIKRNNFYDIKFIPAVLKANGRIEFSIDSKKSEDKLFSLYVLLSLESKRMINNIKSNLKEDSDIIVVGNIIKNSVYLSIKASIVNSNLYYFNLEELGCFGSIINVLEGIDNKPLLKKIIVENKIQTIKPNFILRKKVNITK